MNNVYRVVWNQATSKWVVASELAKGRRKKSNPLRLAALAMAVGLGAPMAASAATESCLLPNGESGVVEEAGECVADKNARSAVGTRSLISPTYSDGGGNDNGDVTSVVIGQGATGGITAGAANAIAIGTNASTGSNGSAIAIGNLTQALGYAATAIGVNTKATATGATAVGRESSAAGEYSTALGNIAQATGQSAIAIGDTVQASGANALAMGTGAQATNINTIALGYGAATSGSNGVAIGNRATATTTGAMAMGANAAAGGTSGALALGWNATANSGSAATPSWGATAVGANTMASGDGATAMGNSAAANADQTTALGRSAMATSTQATAVGAGSWATAADATALGVNAVAQGINSVALGQGSIATDANTVSVGSAGNERRITNVKAGVEDTDAVNIAQLKAAGLVDPIGNPLAALHYDDISLGKATLGGLGGTIIDNLQGGLIGLGSMQAVNGGQLYTMQQDFQNQFNDLNDKVDAIAAGGGPGDGGTPGPGPGPGDGRGAVDPSMPGTGENSTAVGAGASASGNGSTAVGQNASASGQNSTALGSNSSATGNNSVALGAGSVADRDNTVSVGSVGNERQITNVAAGTQRTDAANWGQVQDAVNNVKDWANQKFNKVDRRINGMGAMSAAYGQMAFSAQGINTPNKMGVGVGTMNGQSAIAVGYSRQIRPNMNISFGGAASANDASLGAGFSVGW